MMPIMRMRCAILTIAYFIYAVFVGSVIREGFGKIAAITEYRFSQVFCQMASCHSIGGMYHVASAFPLTHNYRTALA
jgi:hypothetical protein